MPPLNISQNIPLNMPIWNKPTSKGYRQELSIIIKIYTKKSKYKGNRDSFNFKLTIFYNIYRYTNILYKTKVKAFQIGRAHV